MKNGYIYQKWIVHIKIICYCQELHCLQSKLKVFLEYVGIVAKTRLGSRFYIFNSTFKRAVALVWSRN